MDEAAASEDVMAVAGCKVIIYGFSFHLLMRLVPSWRGVTRLPAESSIFAAAVLIATRCLYDNKYNRENCFPIH